MLTTEPLKTELETYANNKDRLLADGEGKFVVICRDVIAGIWDTYERALDAGYVQFGLAPFLVKQIKRHERPRIVTRVV
ncbi:MAG TPA: hypothetical protein VMF30_06620 [Pirellulales bacterium]|nr:hypothetical protein [Pirellulales bacterium]